MAYTQQWAVMGWIDKTLKWSLQGEEGRSK